MSLFACENCEAIENTALCGVVFNEEQTDRKLVCSKCNPDIGRWHQVFPREFFTKETWERIPDSRYVQRVVVS